MSFKTNIKYSNITNLSDARFAAAVGMQYIGFCFDKDNENYITPLKAKEIIDWVSGTNVVAEFGNQSIAEIIDISNMLNVQAIEVNNAILPDELLAVNLPVIKKININQFTPEQLQTEIDAYKDSCDAFYLNQDEKATIYSNTILADLCKRHQIIINVPQNNAQVVEQVNAIKPYAISILGGDEEKVGVKDFDELNELLELLMDND